MSSILSHFKLLWDKVFFMEDLKIYQDPNNRQEIKHRPVTDRAFISFFAKWSDWNGLQQPYSFSGNINSVGKYVNKARKTDLVDSVFHHGMELLRSKMPAPSAPDQEGERLLRGELNIEMFRAELQSAKKYGNTDYLSSKENEIADRIQSVVSKYPHSHDARSVSEQINILIQNTPAGLIKHKIPNCLSASKLGAIFMHEAGLKFLMAIVPGHSFLLLIKSNGQIEWKEMQKPFNNQQLTDDMIVGFQKDGTPITTACLVEFSKKPDTQGIMFEIPGDVYRKKFWWMKDTQKPYIAVHDAFYGQKLQTLYNTGKLLHLQGHPDEAMEAFSQAEAASPKYPVLYSGMGISLHTMKRNDEAIDAFETSLMMDPTCELTNLYLYASCRAQKQTAKANRVLGQFQQLTNVSDAVITRLFSAQKAAA